MRLEVLPACTWCGKPTGGWCDYCSQAPMKAVCSDCGGTDGTIMVRCYDCTRKRALLHGYDCIDHRKEYSDSDDDAAEADLVEGPEQVNAENLVNVEQITPRSREWRQFCFRENVAKYDGESSAYEKRHG